MTNGEKYKTANERVEAIFKAFDRKIHCSDKKAVSCIYMFMQWLDLEAEAEEPLPCPFCGGKCDSHSTSDNWYVHCVSCEYYAPEYDTKDEAIAAHNRVARAVMEKEANDAL